MPGTLLPLRARVSVSCTDPGPWPSARLVPIVDLPLQEVASGMKVMYEGVAEPACTRR
jgi:hypothetical protein